MALNPQRQDGAAQIELDDTDHRIIALLRADGRLPYRSIAASWA